MIITTEMLIEEEACYDGLVWFIDRNLSGKDIAEACTAALKDDHFDYASWLLSRFLNRKNNIRHAVNAAELVLPISEEEKPEDTSPRAAIDAAKKVIENDTEENRIAAKNAANAADATFYSDDDVVFVAARAAYVAARAAADGAYYSNSTALYALMADELLGNEIIAFGLKLAEEQGNDETY